MPPRPRSSGHPRYGGGVEAIEQAATAIAMEEGLSALTLRGVAERAGVSHALVRHHFGTRDRLMAAVVEQAVGRTLYLEARGEGESLASRIDSTRGELRLQYELLLAGDHAETIEDAYTRYRSEVSRWLSARGVEGRDDLVLLVVALLDGLALQRLARDGAVAVDEAFAAFEALFEPARE